MFILFFLTNQPLENESPVDRRDGSPVQNTGFSLPEDLCPFPIVHLAAHKPVVTQQAPNMELVHRRACRQNTGTHKAKINYEKENLWEAYRVFVPNLGPEKYKCF